MFSTHTILTRPQQLLLVLVWLTLPSLLYAAPIANIFPVPESPPAQIELDGTASNDPDGRPLTYQWRQLTGPTSQLQDATNSKAHVILRRAGDYTFSLIVTNDRGEKSPASQIRVTIKDIDPFAHAGHTFAAKLNTTVTLDGTKSDDPNGQKDSLSYRWTQSAGAPILLTNPNTATPSFIAKQTGLYRFVLTVEDSGGHRDDAEVTVIIIDPTRPKAQPPSAHISVYATELTLGESLRLDGTRSRSLAQLPLQYNWELVKGPAQDVLSETQKDKALFRPTKAGSYLLRLTVQDAQSTSPPRTLRINVHPTQKKLPQATTQHVSVGFETTATLDGSKSKASDDTPLTYAWTQLAGPRVTLDNSDSATPSFFVLNKGTYHFQLIVAQGDVQSAPSTVIVRVNEGDNKPPTVDVGPSLLGKDAIDAGNTLPLTATASDPEGDTLSYTWRQVGGIPALLQNPYTKTPTFLPISYGRYTFELLVSDGHVTTFPGQRLQVEVHDNINHIPVAHAGETIKALAGTTVQLDGTKSEDQDPKDTLTYIWRQVSPTHPDDQVRILTETPEKPTFLIPKGTDVKTYTFGLIVDDGKLLSTESHVDVEVIGVNQPPVAKIIAPTMPQTHTKIVLDGTKSSDPNPTDTLTYTWKQLNGPKITLVGEERANASFIPTEPGLYAFSLLVSDGTLLDREEIAIQVQATEAVTPSGGFTCQTTSTAPPPLLWLALMSLLLWSTARKRQR